MTRFDPNAASLANSGIFGLPYNESESALVYLPVPWDVTTSDSGGTCEGPSAIFQASKQVDLYDLDVLRPYESGLYMLFESPEVRQWNQSGKKLSQEIIHSIGSLHQSPRIQDSLNQVNQYSERLNQYVYQETQRLIKAGKLVGIVGGDHSVSFGAIQAMSEQISSFGILHFNAHSDTRKEYEGFTWSHASIMYNILEKIPQVQKLVQVGIRDICEEEVNYILYQKGRVQAFFDRDLARKKLEGTLWSQISKEIISCLPDRVWISFDIDGLDPRFCPHTETPVPGGMDLNEVNYLLSVLVRAGKKIIGFDLNEVAPNPQNHQDKWDANVGARLLYKLSAWTLASQNKARLRF